MKKNEGVTIVEDGATDPRVTLEQARPVLSREAWKVVNVEHHELALLVQRDQDGVFLDIGRAKTPVHNGTIQTSRDVAESLRIVADNVATGRPSSEPKISPTWPEAEHACELTWGNWSFTARCEAIGQGEQCVNYRIVIAVHGDNDGGEHGMFGELSTGGMDGSPEDAAMEAKRFRPLVTSLHDERDFDEDDSYEHERTLDLSPIIDAAVAEMKAAMQGEFEHLEARAERRMLTEHLGRATADDKVASIVFKRTEDYEAFKAALAKIGVELAS